MVNKLKILFFLFFFSFLAVSCATSKMQYKGIDKYLENREFDKAIEQIKDGKEENYYTSKDKALFYLDLGLLYHFAGKYEQSNELLADADSVMDELYTQSLSRVIGSFSINDNTKEYRGDDYEFVFINIFKALNYINLDQYDEATVEIRRIDEKLEILASKYENLKKEHNEVVSFHNSSLARFMGVLLYRVQNELNDADVDLRLLDSAIESQHKIYGFINRQDLKDALDPVEMKNGEGGLNVVAFTGLSPDKIAKRLNLLIAGNTITVHYDEGDERYRKMMNLTTIPLPGRSSNKAYWFKFEFPELRRKTERLADNITIQVDGNELNEEKLLFIEDIAKIAKTTFDNNLSSVFTKTIVRASVKYIGVMIASEVAEQAAADKNDKDGDSGFWAGFLVSILGSAIASASENADLRMCYFFPSRVFVSRSIILPEGKHEITVNYYKEGSLLGQDYKTVEIKENKITILESFNF